VFWGEVGELFVDVDALLFYPLDACGVAGDEVGCHDGVGVCLGCCEGDVVSQFLSLVWVCLMLVPVRSSIWYCWALFWSDLVSGKMVASMVLAKAPPMKSARVSSL